MHALEHVCSQCHAAHAIVTASDDWFADRIYVLGINLILMLNFRELVFTLQFNE